MHACVHGRNYECINERSRTVECNRWLAAYLHVRIKFRSFYIFLLTHSLLRSIRSQAGGGFLRKYMQFTIAAAAAAGGEYTSYTVPPTWVVLHHVHKAILIRGLRNRKAVFQR